MQTNLQATKASELKARASEESLRKEITSLKEKLAASISSDAVSTTVTKPVEPASSAASEKLQVGLGKGDAGIESQPADVVVANEVQQVDNAKMQDVARTEDRLSTKTNVQPASTAESEGTVSESAATQNAAAAAAAAASTATVAYMDQKKGRKRKANAPKKNVLVGTDVEIVDVPPFKKAATQAPGVEAEQAVECNVVPTQKKIAPKKVGTQKIAASTASTEASSENHSANADESTKLPPSKKFTTKSAVANKVFQSTPPTESTVSSTVPEPQNEPTANSLASTVESKKEEEMKMKLDL